MVGLLQIGVAYILFNNKTINAYENNTPLISSKIASINKGLNKEVKNVRVDVNEILKTLDAKNSFQLSHIDKHSENPYYVFKDGELIFWSDQKYAFNNEFFKGEFLWKSVQDKSGVYIFHKRKKKNYYGAFEVVFVIPLYVHYQIENNYLNSSLNKKIFKNEQVEIFTESKSDTYDLLIDGDKTIASIKFLTEIKHAATFSLSWVLLVLAGIVLLLLYIYYEAWYLHKQRYYWRVIFFLTGSLFLLRFVMLYAGFPSKFVNTEIFDPKFFAYSTIYPSMADLFFNVLCYIIVLGYLYSVFPYLSIYRELQDSSNKLVKYVVSFVCIACSYLSSVFFYFTLDGVYTNSQWSYDITEKINFSIFEFFYVFIFLLLSAIYFLINRMFFRVVFRLNSHTQRDSVYVFFVVGILTLFLNKLFFGFNNYILLINTIYITTIYYQGLFINFHRFRYGAYVYLIITGICCALFGAIAVYQNAQYKERLNKERFADQLILHHDYQGEFLLGEVSKQIEHDNFIVDMMLKPFSAKGRIIQKIRRSYIGNYFDKYQINILLYDVGGNPYYKNETSSNYYDLYKKYNKAEFSTDVKGLCFVNYYEENNLSKYLKFITLRKNGLRVGYIVLNLTLKKINPNSVYPILLQNKKYISTGLKKSYNYAVYEDEELLYSAGEFNYEKEVKRRGEVIKNKGLNEFFFRDYHHYVFDGVHNKRVIVSSKDSRVNLFISNFSFLFLCIVFFLFATISVFSIITSSQRHITNYSTKIHVYLNMAYLFPLIIVSITTLSIINTTYEADLEDSFKTKAESIGSNLINYLEQYKKGELSEDEFQISVNRLTKYSESDINLFTNKGELQMTTQPLIYEANLLSRYLNPDALLHIYETKHKLVLLDENIGEFKYKCVYVSLVLQDTGEMLGILSIPFYNSKYELNEKKIVVFSSIMNVFTVTFILILLLSYFASHALTYPLRMISQTLKKTTLGWDNEKIDWPARDEIGILVHEYNEMIEKLGESRKALSRQEKESAWKEMAQQVAHEIKNPLTPMKLKIQHLQRTLDSDQHTKEALQSLLQQVDTLNDIATSFSSFAKMPIAVIERVDLKQVIVDTVELYKDNVDVTIELNVPDEPVFVQTDKLMMGRIFTNIILNSIQSVPATRKPCIHIKMYENELSEAVMAFTDNGDGIPEKIQEKIFTPNFSTKFSGSGIGLTLAKRGVEQSGGRIWFDTEKNIGTTFFIILPMR